MSGKEGIISDLVLSNADVEGFMPDLNTSGVNQPRVDRYFEEKETKVQSSSLKTARLSNLKKALAHENAVDFLKNY